MADQSISQLPVAATITGNELTVVVQNGITKQAQVSQIANAISPGKLITSVSFVGNNLIFFYSDGTTSSAGPIPGYVSATVNGSGHLILTNSLGYTTDAGSVVGPQGPTGATGATGATGPQGPQGTAGTPGAAASVTVGSTTTLSAGSYATVNNSGTSSAAILNFGIPAGPAGAAGAQGAQGPVGPGVAAGGNTNQVLAKIDGTDYNTKWITIAGLGTVTSVDGSGGTTGLTLTGGPITNAGTLTLGGRLNVANGGTGASTLTGYLIGNGTSAFTASSTIPTSALSGTISNAQLTNSAITIGSTSVSLGSTITTLAGVSISGSTNTLTNIGNSSLTNSSLTVGTTNIALGATSLTLGGLTSVAVTQDPVSALQLATKQYVDAVAQGLNTKAAVLVATTANITLSGEQTIDGITTSLSRVLVKNQTLPANNGIYLSNPAAWTRAADASTWNQLISAYVFVEEGTTQADTGWVCTVDPGGTLGVTAVTWAQFSGAGSYTAGTGLTLTGTQFSITNTGTAGTYGSATLIPVITTNAQGQVTSVTTASNPQGTVTSVAALTLGTSGTDLSSTVANGTTTPVITLNVPTASATNRGALSAADWTTFNNKGSGTVTSITSSTLTVAGTSAIPTVNLTSGIVTAGTTGSSTLIPVITVDTYGRVTAVTTASNPQGTVTSVSGTGTVSGISLSGTVTSSGSLTLGGTLDLSSPPAIGGTTPAAITGTTITATKYVGISGGTF